jgi:hypothetical protein
MDEDLDMRLAAATDFDFKKHRKAQVSHLERHTCHDCGVFEGQIHQWDCDMERCPFCGGQLISCECDPQELGVKEGMTDEQAEQAVKHKVEEKGRIPYILYLNVCAKCGTLWPEMFHVPDEEWERYIEPGERDKMLCLPCYEQIKAWIEESAVKVK